MQIERKREEDAEKERLDEEVAEFGGKFELNRIEGLSTASNKNKVTMKEKKIIKGKPVMQMSKRSLVRTLTNSQLNGSKGTSPVGRKQRK